MPDKITILIVDDLAETRENVRKLLQFEPDLEVIAQAGTGEEALAMAKEFEPDVILMDINMPGLDGIAASQAITQSVPATQIIIMSVQSEADYLRRAMLAGARDFLMKPFSGDELVTAVRRVHQMRPKMVRVPVEKAEDSSRGRRGAAKARPEGKVIAIYSPKGGCGCTTIASNLAVALAMQGQETLVVDADLQFGDVGVMLNMKTTTSLMDLVDRISDLDKDLVGSVVQRHSSGARALLAPPRPEMGDLITDDHMRTILQFLRQMYDFVVVDTNTGLDDVTLAILDSADRILLVTQQTLPTLKNVSRFFDLADTLDYERSKVYLVVNRASKRLGISVNDVSNTLKRPVMAIIPTDDEAVIRAADEGYPLVAGRARKRAVSEALMKLGDITVRELSPTSGEEDEVQDARKPSFLARLFGRFSQATS